MSALDGARSRRLLSADQLEHCQCHGREGQRLVVLLTNGPSLRDDALVAARLGIGQCYTLVSAVIGLRQLARNARIFQLCQTSSERPSGFDCSRGLVVFNEIFYGRSLTQLCRRRANGPVSTRRKTNFNKVYWYVSVQQAA